MTPLESVRRENLILKWWANCDESFRKFALEVYASRLGYPTDYKPKLTMTSEAGLNYLDRTYPCAIAEFEEAISHEG